MTLIASVCMCGQINNTDTGEFVCTNCKMHIIIAPNYVNHCWNCNSRITNTICEWSKIRFNGETGFVCRECGCNLKGVEPGYEEVHKFWENNK